MAFLTDWFEFPDKRKDLVHLAERIKENASGKFISPALAMEIRSMLNEFAKELIKSIDVNNDPLGITPRIYIKSALVELGCAVISNDHYRNAVKTCATEYFTLAMMEFNLDKDAMELLGRVNKALGIDVNVSAVINQQTEWIRRDIDEREFELQYNADMLKQSKKIR